MTNQPKIGLWENLICPRCEEDLVALLGLGGSERARLLLARDREDMVRKLGELVEDGEEMDESGIKRSKRRE